MSDLVRNFSEDEEPFEIPLPMDYVSRTSFHLDTSLIPTAMYSLDEYHMYREELGNRSFPEKENYRDALKNTMSLQSDGEEEECPSPSPFRYPE